MIEVYCLPLVELPDNILSALYPNEDALLVDYDNITNLINLVIAGETESDGFGGEFISNQRILQLDYPFKPTMELEFICRQSINK